MDKFNIINEMIYNTNKLSMFESHNLTADICNNSILKKCFKMYGKFKKFNSEEEYEEYFKPDIEVKKFCDFLRQYADGGDICSESSIIRLYKFYMEQSF